MIKQKDYAVRNIGDQVNSLPGYMRSHNSGNIQSENLHIWVVERKKSFLKN